MTYTYDPAAIADYGISRMRYELGDTFVEGGADTCYLCDEEIAAAIGTGDAKRGWHTAKVYLATGVTMRLSYEVDTHVGPMSLSLQARAERWKKLLDELKASSALTSAPALPAHMSASMGNSPYFYAGLHDNDRTEAER